MLVEDATQEMNFSEIPAGEVFSYNNMFYIKTRQTYALPDFCDCVNLSTGVIGTFCSNDKVKPVRAKIVIG